MRSNQKQPKRRGRPGYARVSAFQKVWRHIRSLRLEAVDHRTLGVVGVKGSTAAECLAALRFLGLVAEDGKVSEGYQALHSGSGDALANVIDRAYHQLLSICPIPAVSRKQLESGMRHAYDLKEGRMANAAAALFEWLYEQTGRQAVMAVATAPVRAPAKVPSHGPARPTERRAPYQTPSASGSVLFALTITSQTTEAEIRSMLKRVAQACRLAHSAEE